MLKKWIPINSEKTITTSKYKYVLGYYNHTKWGHGCFRVSKFLKANNYFIGHFVIVPEDFDTIAPILITLLKGQ